MPNTSIAQAVLLATLSLTAVPSFADRSVNEQHDANPRGSIQINGVSGSFEVIGWEKPQVQVSGSTAGDGDVVEISGDPAHLTVQVHGGGRSAHMLGGGDEARLVIHVPAGSSVNTTLVSADFKTSGLTGDLELHTVSGDAKGQVGGNLRVNSVSGDVRVTAPAARALAVKTVSGDIETSGGAGETEISTVSGSTHISLGEQSHVHFKSTSGDIHMSLGLTHDAVFEGESLSGNVTLAFHETPAADFDVQTRTGDIQNCFGPKPTEPTYGPGQRLVFKNGEGSARVRIMTHTGDVSLCTDNAHPH